MNIFRSALALFAGSHDATAKGETKTSIHEGLKAIDGGDYETAYRNFLPEAIHGNKLCQGLIGRMYEEGKGVPQDFVQAADWYRRAADQGYSAAQVALGVLYQMGHGVILNYAEAMHWYRAAAAQGHARAMYDIGTLYDRGQGVERDPDEAARWYAQAAEHGYAP